MVLQCRHYQVVAAACSYPTVAHSQGVSAARSTELQLQGFAACGRGPTNKHAKAAIIAQNWTKFCYCFLAVCVQLPVAQLAC